MKEFRTPVACEMDMYVAAQLAPETDMIHEGVCRGMVSGSTHRKAAFDNDDRIVCAGSLPAVMLELNSVVTAEDNALAKEFYRQRLFQTDGTMGEFPWPEKMFDQLVGRPLPMMVAAVQDGQTLYKGIPSLQIASDVAPFGAMASVVEAKLMPYLWLSSAVATEGREEVEWIYNHLKRCHPSQDEAFLWAMAAILVHDFGYRGGAAAQISAIAHLINFRGSDSTPGMYAVWRFLSEGTKPLSGSVPASAHWVVETWKTEAEGIRRACAANSHRIFSQVIDTYNADACRDLLLSLVPLFERDGGKLVMRPDSGDVIAEVRACLDKLRYGNPAKGIPAAKYDIIDGLILFKHAGVIQGDGTDKRISRILWELLPQWGYSPLCLVIGRGEKLHLYGRSHIETGQKLCEVVAEDGTMRAGMKASSSLFKLSYPCAFAGEVDVNGRAHGLRPITMQQLLNHEVGSLYHVIHDNRPNAPRQVNAWDKLPYTFADTVALAERSWRATPPKPESDPIPREVRERQIAHMAKHGVTLSF